MLGRPLDYLSDTQMLTIFGTARESTEAEFGALIQTSGMEFEWVIETPSPVRIMEVAPV